MIRRRETAACALACALVCAAAAPAWAQQAAASEPALEAGAKIEVTARARAIAVPDAMLGAFFQEHASHWDGQANMAYGVALKFRQPSGYEFGLAFDYADLKMQDQFWLENDEPPTEADYTQMNLGLVSAVVSMNWYWPATEWLAPYAGLGLGAGFVLGETIQINPRQGSACRNGLGQDPDQFAPDVCFTDDGEPDPTQLETDSPDANNFVPVVPVVRVGGGLRFQIEEVGVIRLEIGFQDYVYAGLSAGVQF
jgi:opacity protein-like surface antigen